MTLHVLKTNTPLYQHHPGPVEQQLRLNDRSYHIDDTITLRERDPHTGQYTGRQSTRIISAVQPDPHAHWTWAEIDHHGLILLTLSTPTVAYSDLNPHRASEGPRQRRSHHQIEALADLQERQEREQRARS